MASAPPGLVSHSPGHQHRTNKITTNEVQHFLDVQGLLRGLALHFLEKYQFLIPRCVHVLIPYGALSWSS